MSLFPRTSTFGPTRHELGPFFNLFNDTFSEIQRLSDNMGARNNFSPKFDVKETNESYTLEGELPGIDQKDVTVEFSDEQTLTIKARTEHHREEGQRPTEATEVKEGEGASSEQPAASESKEVATTGSTEVTKHEPHHTYWVSERSVGEFARSFSFPNRVDQENVKASLKNGILSVVVPKLAKKNANRRINIE